MATVFLTTANTLLPSPLSLSASSSSSLLTPPTLCCPHKHNAKRQLALCKAVSESTPLSPNFTKRSLSISFITSFTFFLAGKGCSDASAAILEADEDDELMEKIKRDRKKRLEKQGVISSSNKETEYLQDLVYKLSKIGLAIDNNDLSTAGLVLGGSTDTDWVKNANKAFNKLSSSPEEKTQVDTFNSSLANLISSVTRNDVESSKLAFVWAASSFEKWTTLTGLIDQLKGL